MSKRISGGFGIALGMALFFGVSSAHATTYTLEATIHMDDGFGNVVDIVPVYDDTGATTCFGGGCTGPDFLIFEVSVISGTFEEISGGAIVAFPQDLGYYAGPDTAPSGTSTIVGGIGRFDFDTPNLAGDSTRLFISFAALTGNETVSFSATPVGFVLFNEIGGIISPIPEPGTAPLIALGLVALAMRRRQRSDRVA
jgi:hypothetical protein